MFVCICIFCLLPALSDIAHVSNNKLPSELLIKRKGKFTEKFIANQSLLEYFAIQ